MVWSNYKIIAVTPAGRRRYMELLFPQLLAYHRAGVLDEYHFWVNTVDIEDIRWMIEKNAEYPEFVKLIQSKVPYNGSSSIYNFFTNCIEDNTIYVRYDDDVVLIDTVDSFKSFIDFRINNPEYFLIYPTILNNAVITHILQRNGKLSNSYGHAGYSCCDEIGWSNPEFAKNLHNDILEKLNSGKTLDYFHMENWILYWKERVSINGLCWIGSDFRNICNGIVGNDEEKELSVDMPIRYNKINCIYGGYCTVHYSFFTQRSLLDGEGFLEKYKAVLNKEE